jgi:hypothetical protein
MRDAIKTGFGDLKKSIDEINKWRDDLDKRGGPVTRDNHFSFCDDRQGKCAHAVGMPP